MTADRTAIPCVLFNIQSFSGVKMNSEKYYKNSAYNMTPAKEASVSVFSIKLFEILISLCAIAFTVSFFFTPMFKTYTAGSELAYSIFDHLSFIISGLFSKSTAAFALRALPYLAFEIICIIPAVCIIISAIKRIFKIIFRGRSYTEKKLESLKLQADCGSETHFLRSQRNKSRLSVLDTFRISNASRSPYYIVTIMMILYLFFNFVIMSFAGIRLNDEAVGQLGTMVPYSMNLRGLYYGGSLFSGIIIPLTLLALYYVLYAVIKRITRRKIVKIVSAQYE